MASKTARPKKVDMELRAGTEAHYADPAYYTSAYAKRSEDVGYYEDLAHEGWKILELGCGNGRITIPMAKRGASVVGVDLSRPMLADLKANLSAESVETQRRIQLRRGDMRTIRLKEKFELALCPFNAFLHLYERVDVEKFLATVRLHLKPRGRFVFDVSMPDAEELARKPGKAFRVPDFVYPGVGKIGYTERFEYEPLRQVQFVSMEFVPRKGGEPFMTPLCHRQFFPQELEALLHYNGFEIELLEGDFDGPATNESRTLIYTCKARSR